ncbi:hypothetical protein Fcan01_25375 [Folsomia candida]|uniref:Uncharacterized protein n=1 Tax=Folsomia candida TaxID=158441 RepID=A0A226D521_FOLCA|nr:hypothetical protein Fcan01_25375 [Folsomia candida]
MLATLKNPIIFFLPLITFGPHIFFASAQTTSNYSTEPTDEPTMTTVLMWDYCSYTRPCPPTFFCSRSRCECRDAIYKRKDHNLRSCQTIVSGTCFTDMDCVQGSYCDTLTRKCMCHPGQLSTPTGECRYGFGTYCNILEHGECNIFEGLQCIDGRCACADSSLIYEFGRKIEKG